MNSWSDFWDRVSGSFWKVRHDRTDKRHARSGVTKTPLWMRKEKSRRKSKAARRARKMARNRR